MDKPKSPKYINSTLSCIVYAFLLTFGFIFTTIKPRAPYGLFVQGLAIGLGVVLSKRLVQKWDGQKKSFSNNKHDEEIPIK